MDCPSLNKACSERLALIKSRRECEGNRTLELINYKNKQIAYQAAATAYAEEVLSPILGGSWVIYSRGVYSMFDLHPLFDHPLAFRRKGTRGPITTKNAALIGQPYGVEEKFGSVEQARYLQSRGVGVWTRPNMSAWYPGETHLVLAAEGLLHLDPRAYGFEWVVAP